MNNQILHYHLTQLGLRFEDYEVEDKFLEIVQSELSNRNQKEKYKPDVYKQLHPNDSYTIKDSKEILYDLCKEIFINKDKIKGLSTYPSQFNEDITTLHLNIRNYHCLKRAKLTEISVLLSYSEDEYRKIRNLGRKGVEEVIGKLCHWYLCIIPIQTFEDFDEIVYEFMRMNNIEDPYEMRKPYTDAKLLLANSDFDSAFGCFLELAKNDYLPAKIRLMVYGFINEESEDKKKSVYASYIDWNKLAAETAELGFGYSQLLLAWCYGTGTKNFYVKSEKEAFEWCQKAAVQDIGYAACQMANCYRYGLGVDANFFQEDTWLKRAENLTCYKGIELYNKLKWPKAC